MKASRNTVRLHRDADLSSFWEELRDWVRRNVTNEKVAEVGLAFATAVAVCCLGSRLYAGMQNYVMYAY